MAKRKNAVALFEVITATKRKEAAAAAQREPQGRKWWFKGKAGPGGAEAAQAPVPSRDDPTAGAVLSPAYVPVAQLTQAPAAAVTVTVHDQPPSTTTAAVPVSAPAVVQRVMPATFSEPQSVAVQIPSSDRQRRAWFGSGVKKLGLDPNRQEVTLRFRYTTAIISGFAVLVIVGLAYVAGRGTKPAVTGSNSPSSDEIRRGDILAGVLNIGADRSATIESQPAGAAADAAPPEVEQADPAPGPQGPDAQAGAKPAVKSRVSSVYEDGMPRVLGLNYVIIQIYPNRKDAEAAQKALQAGGIECTVEPVPENWAANPKLWSVIGTRGFARIKNVPEYKQYTDSILKVSKTYAGNSNYKKFAPAARKWQ